MTQQDKKATPVWPIYLAMAILLVGVSAFVLLFMNLSSAEKGEPVPKDSELVEDTYTQRVNELLAVADATRGAELIRTHGCTQCHTGIGANNKFAPLFTGIATRAKERRPPLTVASYLYESIVHPNAFMVEGYRGQMPTIYGQMPDDELGSILAFLLTLEEGGS